MVPLPLLAKPSGITLDDHTRHVREEALRILDAFPFLERKYRRLTGGKDLRRMLREAADAHDLGKGAPQWQRACRTDYEVYRRWRRRKGLDPDVVNAADYRRFEDETKGDKGFSAGKALRNSRLRHEFASLDRATGLSSAPMVAVAAHHGKLAERHRRRWREDGGGSATEHGPYYRTFVQFIRWAEELRKGDVSAVLRKRYTYDVLRGLLRLADTRASRMESGGDLAPLEPFSVQWPDDWYDDGRPSYRPVQRIALEMAEADAYVQILRAPTGSGKTAGALLWARRQVERGRADRVAIALPTRFTANALAAGAVDLAGETGLYHSSAFFNRYGELTGAQKAQAREAHALAQRLATPVTVSTIDHLLIALTGAREAHHDTFAFLTHAAVIIDEADFYDPFVQANLKFLLDALRALQCPVLVMSATVPESARVYYGVEAQIVDADKAKAEAEAEAEAKEQTPPQRVVVYAGEVAEPADAALILRRMLSEGRGIVYANTIARAMAYRAYLEDLRDEEEAWDVPVIVYHSRFTEPHKKAKEDLLVASLGKAATESATGSRGIAVLTQIGEMSINVSAPLMLSDACPWDRLSQRIGRLNRFRENESATCYVVAPIKKSELYPAPYGEYKQGAGWQASAPLTQTLEHLAREFGGDGQDVTPLKMTGYVNALYPEATTLNAGESANVEAYERLVRSNLLVIQDAGEDEDSGSVGMWQARQIGPQVTVLTVRPSRCRDWDEWQLIKLRYGLEVPRYMVERDQDGRRGKKVLQADSIKIGFNDEPDEVPFYYAPTRDAEDDDLLVGRPAYDADFGLFGLYDVGTSREQLAAQDFGDG